MEVPMKAYARGVLHGSAKLEHLFLGDKAANARDMTSKGRGKITRGEASHFSKLKESQVREIRRLCAEGKRQCEVAVMFGVCRNLIGKIVHRKCWSHIE
jgi:hypothetical protein